MGRIDDKTLSISPVMGRIERMVEELCPEGVEYVKLGNVCSFQNGYAFKSNLFKTDGAPIVRITNINGLYVDDSELKYFDPNDYKVKLGNYEIHRNDILVAMSGATTGKIGKFKLNYTAYLNQRVGKFVPNSRYLNNDYLYHILRSISNDLYIMAGGGAQPNLSSNKLMSEVQIPLPPLPVQEAIVEILDKFDRLSASLQAELQARKQQYEYYRNQLLTRFAPEQPVTEYSLGELARIKNGRDYKHLNDGDIPVYGSGGVMTYKDAFTYDKPSVLLPRKGSIDKVFYTDNPFWNVDTVYYTEINNSIIIPKYLFYCFSNIDLAKYNTAAGAIPSLTQKVLNAITFNVPSLEEQARIVAILDKFEALVNDLSQGLPAEIAAVQEQYEYYRNKLLTFKTKE